MNAKAKLQQALESAHAKVQRHRAQVVLGAPFFGALLLKQKLVATNDVATMATNGKELFFNPEYVMNQRPEYLEFDCAHEALHPALLHHTRRGNRDWGVWNEACDYAINPILVDAGFHIMPDALLRDDLRAKSAEDNYRTLMGERQQSEGEPDPDGEPGEAPDDSGQDTSTPPPPPKPIESDQDDDDQPDDQDDQPDDSGDSGDGQGESGDDSDESGDDGAGGSGGSEGGDGEQQQVPSFGGTGAILDAPVANEAERAQEEQDWKIATVQAANLAKSDPAAGDLPGDLIRQIDELVKPIAPWRELLRRFMDQFAKADYTWSSPNRRSVAAGTYLPSLRSESMPPMLFLLDCSGSMPVRALTEAAGELQSVVDTLQPEFVDFGTHDTRMTGVTRFEPGDDIVIEAKGGGGTKFAPVCDWINNADDDYCVVVWFTDMEAWDWDQCEVPDVPILFIDWTCRHDDPHFGEEVIALQDDWS